MLNLIDENKDFCLGIAHQKYQSAEDGIQEAFNSGCTHWYVDGSLIGEMVENWNDERIENLNNTIGTLKISPIFHGNFKAPLASDVEDFRVTAVKYVKKEVEISQKINAPLIIHGGCIVEPKLIVKAKKIALNNYVTSIKELAEYAGERGVDIYLENLSNYKNYRPFHYIFTHMDEYSYVLDKLEAYSNVHLFFDIGHANVCGGEMVDVINNFHNKIKGISFSNNNGIQDQHFGIHDGTIDYEPVMASIYKNNWQGLIAFETRNQSAKDAFQDLVNLYTTTKEKDLSPPF